MSEPEGQVGRGQFLGDQLTLSQPGGGGDYYITTPPPQDFLASDIPNASLVSGRE